MEFEKLLNTCEELKKFDRSNPEVVGCLLIHTITSYDINNPEEFYKMLQYLLGDAQLLSNLAKQSIKDRMSNNNKYEYIGKSYFNGALPDNDYNPSIPYKVDVEVNDNDIVEDGYKRVLFKSGGADSKRYILVRLGKDGNYYVWSDSYMGLLADIKAKESTDFWA